jgi:hypothetical protein
MANGQLSCIPVTRAKRSGAVRCVRRDERRTEALAAVCAAVAPHTVVHDAKQPKAADCGRACGARVSKQ